MSVQLTKRRQLYTSYAIFALPLALASVTSAQAQSTSTAAVRAAAGATTSSTTANVVGAKSTVVAAAAASTTSTSTAATPKPAATSAAATTTTTTTTSTTATPKPAATSTGTTTTTTVATGKNTVAASTTADVPGAYTNTSKFGNFLRPFAVNSMWNARPVNPVLGTFVIPTSDYYPVVGPGAFSAGVFEGLATDPPVTVYPMANTKGLWNADAEEYVPAITVPHFPTTTTPATGGDGHADIIDYTTGIVHSFWQLKKVDGKWVAHTYGWTKIDGIGWGDPARYYQGARAAAVPPTGGLIRKHEIDDGLDTYTHALAMSLTFNALSPKPTYVYPATSADTYAASLNSGGIPEGALVMLPASFDTSTITSTKLRKVANTLKKYGAYVVDQNSGTPFYIYVENGTGYNLHGTAGWNNTVAAELQKVRAALRQVVSAGSWLNGEGVAMTPPSQFNLLSMRGPWTRQSGTVDGKFNTWTQSVEFPATTTVTTMVNGTSRGLGGVTWAKVDAGTTMKFSSISTGGAKVRVQVYTGSKMTFDSGGLVDGTSARFVFPAGGWYVFYVMSGNSGPSTARALLEKVTP